MKQLARLKGLFPDRAGLYARIDRCIVGTGALKVGIVPLASTRDEIKPVLETMVADPLGDAKWFPALENRPLTKDVIVVQAPVFDHVETRNSAVVYPLPFQGPPVEFVEASSLQNSHDRLMDCDLHVLASTHPARALVTPVDSEHPRLVVLDSATLAQLEHLPEKAVAAAAPVDPATSPTATTPARYDGTDVIVSTADAGAANADLRASPTNISTYLDLYRRSGIEQLKEAIFDVPAIRSALLQSVFSTCEDILESEREAAVSPEQSVAKLTALRDEWVRQAHIELQAQLVPGLEHTLTRTAVWWKLYYKVDDVESLVSSRLLASFMPQTQHQLEYLVGRIEQAVPVPVPAAAPRPQLAWKEALATSINAVTLLHNTGFRALLTAVFGVQLPFAGLALAGVYFTAFSPYAMGSLALLGIVVGLRQLQKSWLTASGQFLETVESAVLGAVQASSADLRSIYENKLLKQNSYIDEQAAELREVRTAIEQGRHQEQGRRHEQYQRQGQSGHQNRNHGQSRSDPSGNPSGDPNSSTASAPPQR